MSVTKSSDDNVAGIVFGLEDKPPFFQSALAALQHLMSMFISIGAPPTIICKALNMPDEITIYMASTAFFVSGIGTFIQTSRFGPLGSGLLSIQATSFIFPTAFIALGISAKAAYPNITNEEIVAYMTGATIMGSCIQMLLSRMSNILKTVFTPLVCGITVTMVGVSLIKVGMGNFVGGSSAVKILDGNTLKAYGMSINQVKDFFSADLLNQFELFNVQSIVMRTTDYASLGNIGLGALVLLVIIILNTFKSPAIRMSAMVMGFLVGTLVAYATNMLGNVTGDVSIVSIPIPFKYGVSFSFIGFISIALLYVVSTMEATGDLAATSMLSKRPTSGSEFISRLKGGILCDGFASAIAGIFNSFPMAIFAQNNGVIQLTGNASRHVGKYIAVYLFILGLFPIVGKVFSIIPAPVLGGALLLLFGIITATGMRIIFSEPVGRRAILIIGVSMGMGIGAAFEPAFSHNLPSWARDLLHSPVATGAVVAIFSNLLLPNYGEEVV